MEIRFLNKRNERAIGYLKAVAVVVARWRLGKREKM